MSQYEVYKIIKELGGSATTKQISQIAKEKFPQYTLSKYVGNRLKKLEVKGYIKKTINEDNEIVWEIIEEMIY